MGVIVVQMGHVPRTQGATGTFREQELTRKIGRALRVRLKEAGHVVHLMGADGPVPVARGDVFVALHGDSGNASVAARGESTRRGASVGFPASDSRKLAAAWKKAHRAAGWPGGFLRNNHTVNMSQYYMWPKTTGFKHRYLAEHGTLTNSADEKWLFEHINGMANAHVKAINAVLNGGTIGGGGSTMGGSKKHTVRDGDTLIKIGKKFGVSFQSIARANGITSPFTIFPGQVLKIPG